MVESMHWIRIIIEHKSFIDFKNVICMLQATIFKVKISTSGNTHMSNFDYHRGMIRENLRQINEMNGVREG